MDNKLYGIKIIRAYELSWLNTNGKPQLGVLEITQDFGEPEVNTWKLKSFLERINNKFYADVNAVKHDICDCVKLKNLSVITQVDFREIKYFEQLAIPNFSFNISIGLRFICPQTGQPYIGTVNILASTTNTLNVTVVNSIISSFRNMVIVPQSLVNSLFNQLCTYAIDDFILSVHLNRRGGISYQALCSNKSIDLSEFCYRSILE